MDVDDEIMFGLRRPSSSGTAAASKPAASSGSVRAPEHTRSRGVIYFSSVPTDMRPAEIRNEFERFGPIHRHKFVAAPNKKNAGSSATTAMKGLRSNGLVGNMVAKGGLQFIEGWLEYDSSAEAQEAANQMNAKEVFVKRRRRCHGQVWNVKYLPGFQWSDLISERETERRADRLEAYEERVKERRLNEQFRRQVAARHKKATGGADHPAAAGKKHAARAGTSKSLTGSGPVQHPNLWDE